MPFWVIQRRFLRSGFDIFVLLDESSLRRRFLDTRLPSYPSLLEFKFVANVSGGGGGQERKDKIPAISGELGASSNFPPMVVIQLSLERS